MAATARVRALCCDGSPASVARLARALGQALGGGPAVLPYDADASPPSAIAGVPAGTGLLIQTSGSTGAAKRVVLAAAALRASAGATHSRLGGPGRWLLALPAHHIAGAQVIVRALLAGHPPAVLDNRDGFRPERFAAAAEDLLSGTARCYTSLVPTQLHRVIAAGGAGLDALRRFDAVLVGGAAAAPELLEGARGAGVRVVTTYGMSETAGGCVYDGVPLDGVRIRLEEPTGRICLAGPMLAGGYLGRGGLATDGWFRTSDLGEWSVDGRLRVLGRADDVITTGGEKVHPTAVERVLTAQPGVHAACVVGLPDPEWGQLVAAALVCDAPAPTDRLELAVRAELGPPSVPRLLRALPELPLRGIGKPDRIEVARLLGPERLTARRGPGPLPGGSDGP